LYDFHFHNQIVGESFVSVLSSPYTRSAPDKFTFVAMDEMEIGVLKSLRLYLGAMEAEGWRNRLGGVIRKWKVFECYEK